MFIVLTEDKKGKEGYVLAASASAQAHTGKTRLLETQSFLLDVEQASPPALRLSSISDVPVSHKNCVTRNDHEGPC